ncbi:MAG: hypothetical protein IJY87_04400 [Bacilli bacterium]|nr:hypothetical protein [Bacilli bacterium]
MIYLLFLLDILINNYTSYTSYFFIIYLYNKSYKYYLLTGLILDLVIFKSLFTNTLILSLIYLFNKVFKELNKTNIFNYVFINIFNYIVFIFLTNIMFLNNLDTILILLGNNLLINTIFYILSYRIYENLKN